MKGLDIVTDERRWTAGIFGLPRRSAKIKDISTFDASFLEVHAKLAHVMDPQLRLLLECTYEVIVDAGVNPSTVRETRAGVFVGVSSSEPEDFWMLYSENINGSYVLRPLWFELLADRLLKTLLGAKSRSNPNSSKNKYRFSSFFIVKIVVEVTSAYRIRTDQVLQSDVRQQNFFRVRLHRTELRSEHCNINL